jgi:Zn-dependent peptidase ImmA (M78 family)
MKPAKIRIIGTDYQFVWSEVLHNAAGLCDAAKEKIFILNGQTPTEEVDTVLHEVMHAIEHKMGLDHNEEYIRRLATGLVAVFKDNPQFVTYVLAKLKGK